MTKRVSAVLFARHLGKVAAFYREVFSVRESHSDADHVVLELDGFNLRVHQIPRQLMESGLVDSPPQRRELGAIRLDYPVTDIERARREAKGLGGIIDAHPPAWAGTDRSFFLGHDPEGNVFGAKVSE